MECMWQLTAYTYPESISLPSDYQAPRMAITASYWKAWQMLLIMTAYNPAEFGSVGWENYPTLRAMMEMCITSQVTSSINCCLIQALGSVRVSSAHNSSLSRASGSNSGPGDAGFF